MSKKAVATFLTIGDVAEATGVSTDTLRYYEKMKLLTACARSPAGYRLYTPEAVKVVVFIRGAKSLNFTLDEIAQLLTLNASDQSTCAEMIARTKAKIREAELKIKELTEMKALLTRLVKNCPGDARGLNACPIMDHIKHGKKPAAKSARKIAIIAATFYVAAISPTPAHARPVSYVGGTMVMQENDETGHALAVDYTFSPNAAVGMFVRKEKGEKDFITAGPQFNSRLKRWNMPDAQANIWNVTGVGVATLDGESRPSAWTSFMADYETRRIYTGYEIKAQTAGSIESSISQRARVGISPYKGNYDEVIPWVMLEVDHHPSKEDTWVATPLVRAFYQTSLVELGYSSNHHVMFNWIQQF